MLDERWRRRLDAGGAEPAAGLDGRPRADPPRPQRRQHDAGAARPPSAARSSTLPRRRCRAATPTSRPAPAARRPSRSPTSRSTTGGSRRRGRGARPLGRPQPGASTAARSRSADLPFLRWREVEVHRVDLGLGYEPADWPAEYVRARAAGMEMRWNARRPMGLTGLPACGARGAATRRAWPGCSAGPRSTASTRPACCDRPRSFIWAGSVHLLDNPPRPSVKIPQIGVSRAPGRSGAAGP